jgi:hypothetical protein
MGKTFELYQSDLAATHLEWLKDNTPSLLRMLLKEDKLKERLTEKVEQAYRMIESLQASGRRYDEALEVANHYILAPEGSDELAEEPWTDQEDLWLQDYLYGEGHEELSMAKRIGMAIPVEAREEILTRMKSINVSLRKGRDFERELQRLQAASFDVLDDTLNVPYQTPKPLSDKQRELFAKSYLQKCLNAGKFDFYDVCSQAVLVMPASRLKEIFADLKVAYSRLSIEDATYKPELTDPLLLSVYDWDMHLAMHPYLR